MGAQTFHFTDPSSREIKLKGSVKIYYALVTNVLRQRQKICVGDLRDFNSSAVFLI